MNNIQNSKNRSMEFHQLNQLNNKMAEIHHKTKFQLYDNGTVKVSVPTNNETIKICELILDNGGMQLEKKGDWSIPFNGYKPLLKQVILLSSQLKDHKICYDKLPIFIYQLLKKYSINLDGNQKRLQELDYFQIEAVIKANRFQGRILVADDLGVGKTLTALTIADQYKDLWPLLIICPQLLRLKWQDQIKEWLGIKYDDIKIITEKKDKIYDNRKVIIISYDIQLLQMEFRVGIADECYYLKEQSKRSQVCVPILQNCKHVILISGTPLQGKPRDLFNILKIVKTDVFSNKKRLKEFGLRYCDPKYNYIQKKINFNGSSNLEELHYLMKNYIMTRANYEETSCNIPKKVEIDEYVECNEQIVKDVKSRNLRITTIALKQSRCQKTGGNVISLQVEQKQVEFYRHQFTKNFIFARHLEVLEEVKSFCIKNNHQFVTMFGKKDKKQTIQRHVLQKHRTAEEFQEKTSFKIAILSIQQASVGLDLTAASIVVFGELFWNNGVMQSAIAMPQKRIKKQCQMLLPYRQRVEQMILNNSYTQGEQDNDTQYQEEANLDSENEHTFSGDSDQDELDQFDLENLKQEKQVIEEPNQEQQQKLLKLQKKQSTKKDNETEQALNIKGNEKIYQNTKQLTP
ncbi:hypothetical protein pb186bvf_002655 [Paramecium bursaria]